MRESDFLAQNITIPNFMDSWLANSREKKAHPDWLRLNGILCFCGEQGSGKTLSAVQYVRNVCHMYPRMKVISNIELCLDVDNVIYLSKDKGKFMIQSGALEYENDDYSILKIVADNIEGGLQTIQGRLKRYEKDI